MLKHLIISVMTEYVASTAIRMREKLREWLTARAITHMITLTPNVPYASLGQIRRQLRRWDARMNHAVLGGRWQRRPERRLGWIAFPEKLDTNPHWHLCLELADAQRRWFARGSTSLDELVHRHWRIVAPGGTTTAQAIHDVKGAIRYCTKQLMNPTNLNNFEVSSGLHA